MFLAMRHIELQDSDLSLYNRYQEDRTAKYELPTDDQDKAFYDMNLEYFMSLGYSALIFDTLQSFPLVESEVKLISFILSGKPNETGAELFVQDKSKLTIFRTVVFKLMPEQFQNITMFKNILWREFQHVNDMVDPAFGYSPSLKLENRELMEQNLFQDRYAILWQLYVDLRLSQKFSEYTALDLSKQIEKLFPGYLQKEIEDIKLKLTNRAWTHSELLELAGN